MSSQKNIDAGPGFGPRRNAMIRVLTMVFVALLVAMLLLGTVLVLLQLAGLLIGSSDFIIGVSKTLGPLTYWVAAAFGTFTLILAMAHGWKSAD
ncbi:hypothetical protein [Arthrobacter sp. EpRS71]|uniref:hypothetical protein n=1 Tax=Arthrobacter sp. EpRS71 TaxID=1743141 RepID=UPI00074AEDEF|nr:hypothetical protein [Arthrobacter sp. EpRS71]KUM32548.1 hypothetical protein AR689_21560 [Arthrobacter sp. EpRS71]